MIDREYLENFLQCFLVEKLFFCYLTLSILVVDY